MPLLGRSGLRSTLGVAIEALREEAPQAPAGRGRAAGHRRDGRDAGVERQLLQERTEVPRLPDVERRSDTPACDLLGSRLPRGLVRPGLGEGLVQARPEVGGGVDRRPEQGHGHEAARVDGDHRNVHLPGEGRRLAGDDEARVVVRHHEAGPPREPAQQTPALAPRRLDPGPVVEAERLGPRRVGRHPLEDEAVQAAAGPWIVEAEALVDDERPPELPRAAQRVVESVVALETAAGLHPIEDVVTFASARALVETPQACLLVVHRRLFCGDSARRARREDLTTGRPGCGLRASPSEGDSMPRSIEALVEEQVRRWQLSRQKPEVVERRPVVTVTGADGAQGDELAQQLAKDLGFDHFDREIIHRIAESAQLSERVVASVDGTKRELLTDWLAALAEPGLSEPHAVPLPSRARDRRDRAAGRRRDPGPRRAPAARAGRGAARARRGPARGPGAQRDAQPRAAGARGPPADRGGGRRSSRVHPDPLPRRVRRPGGLRPGRQHGRARPRRLERSDPVCARGLARRLEPVPLSWRTSAARGGSRSRSPSGTAGSPGRRALPRSRRRSAASCSARA